MTDSTIDGIDLTTLVTNEAADATAITALQTTAASVNTALADVQNKLASLPTGATFDPTAIDAEITALQTSVAALQKAIAAIPTAVAVTTDPAVTSAIASLQLQAASLQTGLNTLQTTVAAIPAPAPAYDDTAIKASIAALSASLTNLQNSTVPIAITADQISAIVQDAVTAALKAVGPITVNVNGSAGTGTNTGTGTTTGTGTGTTTGTGTGTTTGTTTTPPVVYNFSSAINGKVVGAPYITDAAGTIYMFPTNTATGKLYTDPAGVLAGALFSANGVMSIAPNYCVEIAIDPANGLFKAQLNDGTWWTPERPGNPNAGASPTSPPNFGPTPVVNAGSPPITQFIGGKIMGQPYITDNAGCVYMFAQDANGNFITDAPGTPYAGKGIGGTTSGGTGALFSFNGIMGLVPNFSVALAIDSGILKVQADEGTWWTPERPGNPNAGAAPCAPPNFSAASASGNTGGGTTPATTADPTPMSPAPGTSGKIIQVALGAGAEAAGIGSAAAGDTVNSAPGTYNESIAWGVPLLLTGGGKVVNPGAKAATYTAGAILDATGVAAYAQGQGGFVPLVDSNILGWEVKGFGANVAAGGHDGTGGIRNNGAAIIHIEDCYLTGNQMGVGPHGGDASMQTIKNVLAYNNGLPQDPGYAHNFYFLSLHTIIQGGVTSIVDKAFGGYGHALKSRSPKIEIYGKNYFSSAECSCIDISDGTATPFLISADSTGGTTIEKIAGDDNEVLLGYGLESQNNGNVGGIFTGVTFIVPNDSNTYIIGTTGPIQLVNCTFIYTDGTPMKSGKIVAQGGGVVTGLI